MRLPWVVLVTGASTGIGKAAAIALAREGAKVGTVARRPDRLRETIADIQAAGGQAMPLLADVSNPFEMRAAVGRLVLAWGRLDIVFANAGINGVQAPLEEIEPEEWDETLDTNLKGTFLTLKYAVPYMRECGGSIIVNSSVNGTRIFSNPGMSVYASSKAGQLAFAKMAAAELARYRIRVNVICPGEITTEISTYTRPRNLERIARRILYLDGAIPLTGGIPGTAEQVADLVVFLASDRAAHITGTEVWIDGGQSLTEG